MEKFIKCFKKDFHNKYHYLGYLSIPFEIGSVPYNHIENFIVWLDEQVKPEYCPRWFLNLLHLYGNDNSIVRVKNWRLHKLHSRLTKHIMINDLKTKWGTMRIYGSFTDEMNEEIKKVRELVNPYIKIY